MERRGKHTDVRDVIYHGSSGGTSIWVRDLIHVPTYWEDAGRVSTSGGMENGGSYATGEPLRDIDATLPGGGDRGGGHVGGGDLH